MQPWRAIGKAACLRSVSQQDDRVIVYTSHLLREVSDMDNLVFQSLSGFCKLQT